VQIRRLSEHRSNALRERARSPPCTSPQLNPTLGSIFKLQTISMIAVLGAARILRQDRLARICDSIVSSSTRTAKNDSRTPAHILRQANPISFFFVTPQSAQPQLQPQPHPTPIRPWLELLVQQHQQRPLVEDSDAFGHGAHAAHILRQANTTLASTLHLTIRNRSKIPVPVPVPVLDCVHSAIRYC
jgi:hypothetical protein